MGLFKKSTVNKDLINLVRARDSGEEWAIEKLADLCSDAEAFLSQAQEDWTAAHVNAYNFFGGVARILVPDNLKTGVVKNTRSELVLNKAYQELAEHYGTAIMPARVRTPKDKATVEGAVGTVSTFILATIRNQQFFSLRELNEVIRERLHLLNHKAFQKKPGSRATLFLEERAALLPLPVQEFELAVWKIATVSFNYHVGVDGQFYSVPFDYIKRKADVRATRHVVEVFFEGSICLSTPPAASAARCLTSSRPRTSRRQMAPCATPRAPWSIS